MGRFILITFVFLGFAFYQLSGGADFDPEETRLSRIDAPEAVSSTPLQGAVIETAKAETPAAPIALELPKAEEVLAPKRSFTAGSNQVAATQRDAAEVAELQTAALEAEPVIIVPSLVEDATSEATITQVDFSAERSETSENVDRRIVSGSRVNVRGGPGTDFQVVNRLVRGDAVIVIEDAGTGWVQMRPANGGPVGWIADFLLSEG